MNFVPSLRRTFFTTTLVLLGACARQNAEQSIGENFVTNADANVERTVAVGGHQFSVLGIERLEAGLAAKRLLTPASSEARSLLTRLVSEGGSTTVSRLAGARSTATSDDSLVVGFPMGLVGEQQVFGGVITKVSDGKTATLGDLKLSDLTPVHVRTVVARDSDGNYGLALLGCLRSCGEGAAEEPLIAFPVVAVDTAKDLLVLDLAALGKELNLMDVLDPGGEYTKMKTVSSKTVAFDYSLSTLVFDIEVRMAPKDSALATTVGETVFTGRWYLRLASVFQPSFEPRGATDGVGFFMTERGRSPRIQRWAKPPSVNGTPTTVKYYVKNVPDEFKAAFQSAFDRWNDVFRTINGAPLLSYEFLTATDPRAAVLVPGDVRYHIVEWDLDNAASYGGLGPSIANQHTGEILTANVLIQGPGIIEKYSKWFQGSSAIRTLLASGHEMEAAERQRELVAQLRGPAVTARATRLQLSLGEGLALRTPAELEALEDPAAQRDDFELVPASYTYQQYMNGYFHDMLTHELGHNLGLRHNFRGNLAAAPTLVAGGVSNSVMEYLGRGFRYLDDVGVYDIMALKYGYLGVAPEKTTLFCTDEDVADAGKPANSAECSRDDATNDSFGFFEGRLARAIEYLLAPTSADAPAWTVADMDNELKIAIGGILLYGSSAPLTASRWTNFFGLPGRPTLPTEVKPFVLARLKAKLCDASLAQIIEAKGTPEAKAKATTNLTELRARAAKLLLPATVYQPTDLQCE